MSPHYGKFADKGGRPSSNFPSPNLRKAREVRRYMFESSCCGRL